MDDNRRADPLPGVLLEFGPDLVPVRWKVLAGNSVEREHVYRRVQLMLRVFEALARRVREAA